MHLRLMALLVALTTILLLGGCGGATEGESSGDSSGDSSGGSGNISTETTIRDYNQAFEGVVVKNYDFCTASQAWEGANLDELSNTEALALLNSFIQTGDRLAASMESLNTTVTSKFTGISLLRGVSEEYQSPSKGASDEILSLVPGADNGLSPGLVKSIGDLPKDALADVQKAMADYPNYADGNSTDADFFAAELKELRRKHTVKAVNTGVSTYMGVAGGLIGGGTAGYLITAGVVTVSAPAAVVVGAGVLGGYIGGKIINWMFTPSSCKSKAQDTCTLTTGNIAAEGKIPNIFGEGGTLIFEIDGYAPITITNFTPPKDGQEMVIDFHPVPIDQVEEGESITVGFEEIVSTATECSDITSITAVPSPTNPGPWQNVTVTATVYPAIEGCSASYSMSGTDGYALSGSPTTNASGAFSFTIPGAKEGVHDTVSVRSNGKSHTVVYTF